MCGKQIENPERVIKVLYKIVRLGCSKTHSLPISGCPRKILVDSLFELPWHLHPANQHYVASIRARVWTLKREKVSEIRSDYRAVVDSEARTRPLISLDVE